ncbi:MAG: glycosyltransferase family 39 protein [Bacteroidetes bacterium]|nr:glycosyltransferase family 39 protein [Bacteroidota bacterium]
MNTNNISPNTMNTEVNIRVLRRIIVAFVIILTSGLFIPLINVDAAQYGEISRELSRTSDWTHIFLRGQDYLDKPPLHFWLSALSFRIFGIHEWSYKLPSFLFFILAVHSVIRMTNIFYDRRTSLIAGLFFCSSATAFLMTNDVRTDTIVVGCVAFSVWKLLEWSRGRAWTDLFAASVGIGLAMLAKGPMGIIFPAFILGVHFIFKREWKNIFRWEYLVMLFVIALLVFPMCKGLYEQFDLHPEKEVNGHQSVSGLRFYFWTQSFGRITGESDWGTKYDNGATAFFFTHTFLWTFAPWCLLTIAGIGTTVFSIISKRCSASSLKEFFSTGGFLLLFLALSASRYKLPHYLYVTTPFASVIAAVFFCEKILERNNILLQRVISVIHSIIIAALTLCSMFLLFYVFPDGSFLSKALAVVSVSSVFFCYYFSFGFWEKNMYPLIAALMSFYLVLSLHFYPHLLQYSSSIKAGKIIAQNRKGRETVFFTEDATDYTLDFYGRLDDPPLIYDPALVRNELNNGKKTYLYTSMSELPQVENDGLTIKKITEFDDFPVQFLTGKFLSPASRGSVLRERILLEFGK